MNSIMDASPIFEKAILHLIHVTYRCYCCNFNYKGSQKEIVRISTCFKQVFDNVKHKGFKSCLHVS